MVEKNVRCGDFLYGLGSCEASGRICKVLAGISLRNLWKEMTIVSIEELLKQERLWPPTPPPQLFPWILGTVAGAENFFVITMSSPYGICSGQSGIEVGFSLTISVFCCQHHSAISVFCCHSFYHFSFLLSASFYHFSFLLSASFYHFSFLLSASFHHFSFLLSASFHHFSFLLSASFHHFSFLLSASFYHFSFLLSASFHHLSTFIFHYTLKLYLCTCRLIKCRLKEALSAY